jgi:hypothetical protein
MLVNRQTPRLARRNAQEELSVDATGGDEPLSLTREELYRGRAPLFKEFDELSAKDRDIAKRLQDVRPKTNLLIESVGRWIQPKIK